MNDRKRTSLGVIFLTLFIDLIGFSILFPLFAALMDQYAPVGLISTLESVAPDASPDQRAALFGGVLMGLYSVLQFVAAPLWGALSDRIGRRPVLVLTIGGNTLGYALWIVADSFAILLLSRALCGLMAGNISVATAAVADVTDQRDRAKGMGFVGMAFGLGFILGPAIGGLAYEFLPRWESSGALFGLNPFSSAAILATALSALNLVWVLRRFAETRPPSATTPSAKRPANPLHILGASGGRPLQALIWANLLFTILFAGLEATLVFLAWERLEWGPGAMAGVFVALGFTSALVQGGLVRRLAPRLGERRLAVTGLALTIPAFVLLGLIAVVDAGWLMYLGAIVLALGIGCTMPSLASFASGLAPADRQGWALGAFRSAGSLARAIGPFLGAMLYFAIAPWAPYWIGAALMLVPIVIVARIAGGGPATEAEPGAEEGDGHETT